jgi:hypothetical protein
VAAVDELDLQRIALEHGREHPPQVGDHRNEGRVQLVVAVRRIFVRDARVARERREVAGELQAIEVELARMRARHQRVLAKDRLGAVERLQHQEVGHLRDAVAELAHARRERARALVDQPVQQRRVRRELLGRVDPRLRRDVERVEHDLVVAAPLADAREAEQRIARRRRPSARTMRRSSAPVCTVSGSSAALVWSRSSSLPARQRRSSCASSSPKPTCVTPSRASGTARHASSPRMSAGTSNAIGCASCVGIENGVPSGRIPLARVMPILPIASMPLVERELEEAPRVRAGAAQPHVERVFDVAGFLLKVMRQQEHALRPDDLAVQTHLLTDASMASSPAVMVTFCGWLGVIGTTLRHLACSRSR